jgi:hypothetical protein
MDLKSDHHPAAAPIGIAAGRVRATCATGVEGRPPVFAHEAHHETCDAKGEKMNGGTFLSTPSRKFCDFD